MIGASKPRHSPRLRLRCKGASRVTTPVELWAGADDHSVPDASNTEAVRHALPQLPDFHMVEGSGHFVFLPPCNPKLEAALPKVWAMVCVDPPGLPSTAQH